MTSAAHQWLLDLLQYIKTHGNYSLAVVEEAKGLTEEKQREHVAHEKHAIDLLEGENGYCEVLSHYCTHWSLRDFCKIWLARAKNSQLQTVYLWFDFAETHNL